MKILTCAIFVAAGFLALIPAHTQTVLPISPKFPPPAGLTFAGQWECKAGDLTARLQVTPDRAPRRELTSSAQRWMDHAHRKSGGVHRRSLPGGLRSGRRPIPAL